jgi:REP-associated tyrosine transposase
LLLKTFNSEDVGNQDLFQNRYKSIVCDGDSYFTELVRYIHLNPLRVKLVADLRELERYPYSGHGVILGTVKNEWQDRDSWFSVEWHLLRIRNG